MAGGRGPYGSGRATAVVGDFEVIREVISYAGAVLLDFLGIGRQLGSVMGLSRYA